MELESIQIIYAIWHLWQSPKEIKHSTDISSLNVCKFLKYSIEVSSKMLKKTIEGSQSILHQSTVQKS